MAVDILRTKATIPSRKGEKKNRKRGRYWRPLEVDEIKLSMDGGDIIRLRVIGSGQTAKGT